MCGRRWGKTDLGLHAVIQGHGPYRGALKGAIDGGEMWWINRTSKMAAKAWRMIKRSLADVWINKLEVERRIELPGGGSVTVKSADKPDDLRGDGLDGVVIDEVAYLKQAVWQSVVRPALADKKGWCIFISTPNGGNWFKKIYDMAETRPQWRRWQQPTSNNPIISADELEEAKLELGPLLYAQEFEARFISIEGAIWPTDWFEDSIWFTEWPRPEQIACRVCYCDPSLGKSDKSDYSAIVFGVVDHAGHVWVDASIERRPTTQLASEIVALSKQARPDSFGIESNGFQELMAELIEIEAQRQGVYWPGVSVCNTIPKVVRIKGLTPYLSRGEIHFRRGSRGAQLLVDQLQMFPTDKHDDGPDALAGLVQIASGLINGGQGDDEIDGDFDYGFSQRLKVA